MSRTDAHAPYWVHKVRNPDRLIVWHRPDCDGSCGVPELGRQGVWYTRYACHAELPWGDCNKLFGRRKLIGIEAKRQKRANKAKARATLTKARYDWWEEVEDPEPYAPHHGAEWWAW